ncbi:hypothetical protein RND71_014811 [Anisodus tanguticus]|uniref:glutathione transferase n=1 Tax=Anisodus tanguticus TaxID=243964 RepID=A0AAE1SBZ4_9SOLA|nr:hypothetical protein RND71_014811 [Anisodus tanguticus]
MVSTLSKSFAGAGAPLRSDTLFEQRLLGLAEPVSGLLAPPRVLLTLEEKHLLYEMKYVDLRNKPDWLLDEKWVPDSGVITQALEEKFPEPPLTTPPEKASFGSKIFPKFVAFVKSKDPSDGTEQAILDEQTSFSDYLKENRCASDKSGMLITKHQCWSLGSIHVNNLHVQYPPKAGFVSLHVVNVQLLWDLRWRFGGWVVGGEDSYLLATSVYTMWFSGRRFH